MLVESPRDFIRVVSHRTHLDLELCPRERRGGCFIPRRREVTEGTRQFLAQRRDLRVGVGEVLLQRLPGVFNSGPFPRFSLERSL